ncbi:MAG: PAS domain-containing protein [Deltaproteobacteria bacterium]|nr:PAS domain-containing protein [Deltaproteobacteria bacterium]
MQKESPAGGRFLVVAGCCAVGAAVAMAAADSVIFRAFVQRHHHVTLIANGLLGALAGLLLGYGLLSRNAYRQSTSVFHKARKRWQAEAVRQLTETLQTNERLAKRILNAEKSVAAADAKVAAFRAVIDENGLAAAVCTMGGDASDPVVLEANHEFARHLRVDPADLRNRPMTEIVRGVQRSAILEAFDAVVRSGRAETIVEAPDREAGSPDPLAFRIFRLSSNEFLVVPNPASRFRCVGTSRDGPRPRGAGRRRAQPLCPVTPPPSLST